MEIWMLSFEERKGEASLSDLKVRPSGRVAEVVAPQSMRKLSCGEKAAEVAEVVVAAVARKV